INSGIIQKTTIAIISIVLIIVLILIIIRDIINSITTLRTAADVIASGDMNVQISTKNDDEFRSLTNSFMTMVNASQEYAMLAESIGNGDYSKEVTIRSEKDTLGIALSDMRAKLMRLSDENTTRTW